MVTKRMNQFSTLNGVLHVVVSDAASFFYSFYYFAPKLYSVKSLVTLSFGIMIDTSFLAHYFACSMHHFKMFACVD